jgi:hypothetical protein
VWLHVAAHWDGTSGTEDKKHGIPGPKASPSAADSSDLMGEEAPVPFNWCFPAEGFVRGSRIDFVPFEPVAG